MNVSQFLQSVCLRLWTGLYTLSSADKPNPGVCFPDAPSKHSGTQGKQNLLVALAVSFVAQPVDHWIDTAADKSEESEGVMRSGV